MKKLLFILLLCVTYGFALNDSVAELKSKFYTDVVEANIYKKHYKEYLFEVCKDYDIECQLQTINKIKEYKSVQENALLNEDLKQIQSRVYLSPFYLHKLEKKIKNELNKNELKNQEFISTVDLKRQIYIILLYDKIKDKFYNIGADLISSGNMEKEGEISWGDDHYFDTPTGVFKIKSGWRSEGQYKTYKDIDYQPYGVKDRFIYHIGKLETKRYHVFDKSKQKIEDPTKWKLLTDKVDFAIHSHNSPVSDMGEAFSHGCVRMTDQLNYFLDVNSILHKPFIKDNQWKKRFVQKPNKFNYLQYSGEYLIIFNNI